ncbi:hypothetical protein MSP8887_01895 [Marinomonas spartinae]|uniref:Uncharacterized protein n=1 Tax=Marinomonas spartinae TaxID=1792290 RepID=A0A1A8TFL3_9GAMM|nr:hypothetical protein [Marinomonas spartinae]SBS30952.1 hypothetical protein MSP8886_01981 [Marinomonas spartinae]SBS33241.1 hypothetical protein MSP8887_01895 [Marinomonas spartinae]
MLYPILEQYYVVFALLLLVITWFTRQKTPEARRNYLYGYALISVVGFLLGFKWVSGVIFGLIVLEVGRYFKRWLDKKEQQLKK